MLTRRITKREYTVKLIKPTRHDSKAILAMRKAEGVPRLVPCRPNGRRSQCPNPTAPRTVIMPTLRIHSRVIRKNRHRLSNRCRPGEDRGASKQSEIAATQRRVRFHLSRFRILPRLGSQHTIFRKLVRMIVFDPARHMTPPSLIPHRLVIGGRLGSLQRVHHNLPRGIRFQPKPTTSISQVMQPLCREGLHE